MSDEEFIIAVICAGQEWCLKKKKQEGIDSVTIGTIAIPALPEKPSLFTGDTTEEVGTE